MKNYRLTIDLATLRHLGIGLYSNIPAVLSEVVANSWDANAKNVEININERKGIIKIKDDGWGMNEKEINDRFLKVGYRKRDDKTAPRLKGRLPMGRKGIGKLALFSIANTIEVHSIKLNKHGNIADSNGFIMRADDIEKNIKSGKSDYEPEVVDDNRIKIREGTLVILSDLNNKAGYAETFLRKRLSRRFSVIGKKYNFIVKVNKKPISVQDRDYFDRLDYMWCIGKDSQEYLKESKTVIRHEDIPGIIDEGQGFEIYGWVGTMAEHKSVEEGNNGIVILSRGKVIQENILSYLKEGRVFSKYLIGEIHAPFLDSDDLEDIATSDRQNIKETDQRFALLRDYIKSHIINQIGNVWTEWRNEDQSKEALKNKAIEEWYKELRPQHQKYAKALLGKIASFPVSDPEFRRTLYQHGILAFETLAAKGNLQALERIETDQELERLLDLFEDFDELEAAHYWQITRTRVAVLQKFEKIAPKARETIIRDFIFEHLWLLDPSWERASTDKRMEESVTKEWKKLDAALTPDEKKGRIDIRYRTAAGKQIIIELKKYDRKVKTEELSTQIRKYKSALEKCLKKVYPEKDKHIIEAIFILGSRPEPEEKDEENRRMLIAIDARYITYDQLIKQTRESYADYLEKNEKLSRIQRLVEKI
jgi:hypothetical protein